MTNLPTELLHNIFIQVPFKQRLECTLVCRYWYNALSKRSLLYDIEINNNKSLFAFLLMLQYQPSRSSQVEILRLHTETIFDKRLLYNMCPNLRVFQYLDGSSYGKQKNFCGLLFSQMKSDSKLEILDDRDQCELTRQLLQFGSCTRLTRLKLDLERIKNPRNEIFIHLKSAPNLMELMLYVLKIGVEDHEAIHENAQALKTLDLSRITVIPSKSPHDITPAKSVTTLKIDMKMTEDEPIYHDWYKYLAKKYTNLKDFDYRDITGSSVHDAIKRFTIYRKRIFCIYRKLGIHIPYLHLRDLPIQFKPFVTLDEFGIRVKELKLEDYSERPIVEQLVASGLPKYIESLSLESTNITTPSILQNFPSLTELSITINPYYDIMFSLCDLINILPATLTSFSANFGDIEVNELPSKPSDIEHVSLCCRTINPKLAEIISTYFPKLNRLSLWGKMRESIDIHLPENHFKNLMVQVDCNEEHGYSITSSNWPETRYYIKRDFWTSPANATAEELKDGIVLSLKYTTATFGQCGEVVIDSERS